MPPLRTRTLSPVAAAVFFLISGWLASGLLRAAFMKNPYVHYHADLLVVIDGAPVDFGLAKYQQPVTACSTEGIRGPRERAHFHNGIGSSAHIHETGVSWGQLLQAVGWQLGDTIVVDDAGSVHASPRFMLNGKPVGSISNRVIGGQDRLLVLIGPGSLSDRFSAVTENAARLDVSQDPATCGAATFSLAERLKRSFWL